MVSSKPQPTGPSDGLMYYPGYYLEESYLSAKMQSVFSTAPAPADWAIRRFSVLSRTLVGGVLPLGRNAFGVFYSPS